VSPIFVLVRFPPEKDRDAKAADAFLRSRGVIVRAMASYGLPSACASPSARDDELHAAVAAVAEFLGA